MLANVAPVAPNAVLSALESAFTGADEATLQECAHFTRLLRSLAYDPALFERAVCLLVKFAILPRDDRPNKGHPAGIVESLFGIMFSGTQAPLPLRLRVVRELLRADDPTSREMGVCALQGMCKARDFSTEYEFEFGARSRDYGYYPRTGADVRNWFAAVLNLAEAFALSEGPVAEAVCTAIAHEFPGLWTDSGRMDDLDRLSRAIGAKRFWREGWVAVRQTRTYDGKGLPSEVVDRLIALEDVLRPKDLVDRVRGLVLGSSGGRFDLDDFDNLEEQDYTSWAARAATVVHVLGRDVAADADAFKVLLPELMAGNDKVLGFGRGLAAASVEPREMWNAVRAQMAATENPSLALACGFLSGLQERDRALTDSLLDEAIFDVTLAEWMPLLQAHVVIDGNGVSRLLQSLERGTAPVWRFRVLASGRTCDVLSGPDFKRLILAVGNQPAGISVAVHILSMRLHTDHSDKRTSAQEVLEAGRVLLAAYPFHRQDGPKAHDDYDLAKIVLAALGDDHGRPIVRRLCRDLMTAVAQYEVSAHDHDELMAALFHVHPVDMLDELFSGDQESQKDSVRLLNDLLQFRKHPMREVSDDVIIGWCDGDPKTRYPLAAAVALVFKRPADHAPHEWTSLAKQLLLRAPDAEAVLKELVRRLNPRSWSGSRATKLESRLQLLDQLDLGGLPALTAVFDAAKARLRGSIEAERRQEMDEDRWRSGRFE
jgi:hypothetical protein